MVDEIKCTGTAKFLKDGICVVYAGDFDTDTIFAFFVYGCLRAVCVDTLFKLLYRVTHILIGGVFVTHCLIRNGYASGKIKTKLDVSCAA